MEYDEGRYCARLRKRPYIVSADDALDE